MANLFELGILLSLIDTASAPLRQFGATLNQTGTTGANAMQRLGGAMERVSGRLTAMGAASLALGEELRHLAEKPMEAFIEMDSAMNDLAVATLDKTGQVGAGFEQLRQKVFEIDARLPMTTAQVAEVGTALKSAGVSMEQMLSGAYDAAANLSVVLKMPGDEAGLMVARLREAYGLAGSELPKMADLIQRARFAFGIAPEELRYASAYSAPTLNMLGLTGLDNAQKLLAIQGMGAGWNFQGSSFGTNFSMFLTRLSKGPETIALAKRGTKGMVRDDLQRAGVKLDFFDAHGQLKSVENMISQLENARSRLKAVGGDKMVLDVFGGVFGVEAGRVAELLAEKGMAGYRDALRRMADQASMDQRTKQTMESFKNVWTTFSSNVSNALGTMIEPAARWLEPLILRLGNAVALTREWLGQHQTFAKWTTLIVGGLAVSLVTFGSLLLTAGLFAKVASGPIMLLGRLGGPGLALLATGARSLGTAFLFVAARIPLLASGLRALTLAFALNGGGLRAVFPVIITGLRALGAALFAIPGIGWIAAAIAGVAFLVWRYWTPIKAFAGGLWDGLKTGFAPAWAILRPALGAFSSAFMAFMRALGSLGEVMMMVLSPLAPLFRPVIAAVQAVWHWFVSLLQPVNAGGNAARDFGLRVGTAMATALQWVARLAALLLSLPTKFLQLGASVVDGLVTGITNRLQAARSAVTQLGQNIKGWFANTLGIHSPSRVFIGFGENIGQGAEIGILSRLSATRSAVTQLAENIRGAFANAPAIRPPRPIFTEGPQVGIPNRLSAARTAAGRLSSTAIDAALAVARRPIPVAGGDVNGKAGAVASQPAMVIHFSPTVHVSGGGDAGNQVTAALRTSSAEFEKQMDRYLASRRRVAFGG